MGIAAALFRDALEPFPDRAKGNRRSHSALRTPPNYRQSSTPDLRYSPGYGLTWQQPFKETEPGIGLAAVRYLTRAGLRVCVANLDAGRIAPARQTVIADGAAPGDVFRVPINVADKTH